MACVLLIYVGFEVSDRCSVTVFGKDFEVLEGDGMCGMN